MKGVHPQFSDPLLSFKTTKYLIMNQKLLTLFQHARVWVLALCLLPAGYVQAQDEEPEPIEVGTPCVGEFNAIVEQPNSSSGAFQANPIFQSVGNKFTAPAGMNEAEGILVYVLGFNAETYTLTLYEGPVPANVMDATPITSSEIIVAADISFLNEIAVYWQFDSPVSLVAGDEYFFLIEPSYDGGANFGTPIQSGGGVFGYLEGTTDGSIGNFRDWEMKYAVYACSNTAPVITCPDGDDLACDDDVPAPYTTVTGFTAGGGTFEGGCSPAEESTIRHTENVEGTVCEGRTITRTYYVTDACNNESEGCTQTFNIAPPVEPEFTDEPGNITVNCIDDIEESELSYDNGQDGSCEISGSIESTIEEISYDG